MDSQIIVQPAALEEAIQKDPGRLDETVNETVDQATSADEQLERGRLLAAWNNGMGELTGSSKGRLVMSSPQNAIASRLQTLLALKSQKNPDKYLRRVRAAQILDTPSGRVATADILEVKFDNDDWWGWIKMSWKLLFKPERHAWINPSLQPERIDDDATIAIFSDWGTALYGAPLIANSIAKLGRCDVALHLGDTYYSGADDEVRTRLVGDWPKCGTKTVNRALNGNHEMYSGGQGYFQALAAAPFKQSSSCFAMQNSDWLLICLDSAYVDFDLDKNQVDWATKLVAAADPRKVILLSHHQPFSQLDGQGENLQSKLHDLLNAGRIYAWFFGHEHRLVIYDPHRSWGVKGRLVGNGGFPEFRDHVEGCGGSQLHFVSLPEKSFAPAAVLLDGPNEYISENPDAYSPHGFALLEFEGKKAFETYFSPGGGTPIRARQEL
jgi:hypothetical protein